MNVTTRKGNPLMHLVKFYHKPIGFMSNDYINHISGIEIGDVGLPTPLNTCLPPGLAMETTKSDHSSNTMFHSILKLIGFK